MQSHRRVAQPTMLDSLVVLAMIVLTACTLDVGPNGSDCVVYGQSTPGTPNGLTVLVNLPSRCPFSINVSVPPQIAAFSATILGSSASTPVDAYLYHVVANRLGVAIKSDVTEWNETVNGLVSSLVATWYPAATGYFTINGTPSSVAGVGEDRWYVSSSQVDTATFGAIASTGAYVRQNYYRDYNTTVETDVVFANPYEPVNLTVNVPAWVPTPHRHLWYRNGEFIGEGGQTMLMGAGGPSETVDFQVTTTGSDGTQMRGSRSIVSRENYCSDPNAFYC